MCVRVCVWAEPTFYPLMCITPSTPHAEHTGCTLGHSTFQNRPRSHTGAHTLPASRHKHPHTGPCRLPTQSESDSAQRPPTPTPTLPTQGAVHARESHALQIIFFTLSTSHMDFINGIHGLRCHIQPGPEPGGTTINTPRSLPISTNSGVHQPQVLANHPPHKPHTLQTLLHTRKGDAEAPAFKGTVLHIERTRISACTPVPTFTHGKGKLQIFSHPTPNPRVRVPTLQTGGLRPGKRLKSGETGAAGGSAQQAGPGPGRPIQSSRTRGKRFHAVVHRDPAWREAGC